MTRWESCQEKGEARMQGRRASGREGRLEGDPLGADRVPTAASVSSLEEGGEAGAVREWKALEQCSEDWRRACKKTGERE